MRILKIEANGLDIFKNKIEIDFYAEQRVMKDNSDMLSNIFGNIYANNVISVVGINASGKTSLLKVISFAIELLNGKSINATPYKEVLTESQCVNIKVIFYDEKEGVCKLESVIGFKQEKDLEKRYYFLEEKIWAKKISKIQSKKDLFEFKEEDLIKNRDNHAEYLQDDTSISISISKNNKVFIRNLIGLTNANLLRLIGNYPHELICFLDPSIEYIKYDRDTGETKLKFYEREVISLSNPFQCEKYLSSGTVKGINVILNAMMVFEEGGYLIIDEIENHFNREIVSSLIRFFTNPRVNKNGATLIFSTHYSELLDEFERSDDIYIVRNNGGITVQKLCEILKRNDIKKSEAFKSDYLEGTVPSYESYMRLKEAIINGLNKEG